MNIFATSDDPKLCALWLDDSEKYRAYMLEKWSQDRPLPRFTKRSNPKQEFARCDCDTIQTLLL